MASPLQPQEIKNLGIYGVLRPAEIDDGLIPDEAVTEALNMHFDRRGAAIVRPGLIGVGSTITGTDVYPCVGLHNSQSSTLLAVFSGAGSSRIFWFDNGSWITGLTAGTGSVRIRMVDFGSYTIILNMSYPGGSNTYGSMQVFPVRAESTSYFATTHAYTNIQNMWGYVPSLGETYKSRVYVGGDPRYPSRLFFSSVISGTGRITWSPTADFVDINPGDGEDMTGLKRFSLELLVFKPNYIYRFKTSGVDPDPLIKIGTRSHESIVEGKRGLYFHHDTGIYRYSGGYPEEISRAISDVINAIPFGQFDDIAGWRDSDHIYWSVGTLIIPEVKENVTWRNVVLRYTESSDIWTVYSYAREIRRGGPFISSTTGSLVIATDNGVVAEINRGVLDLGEPIRYRMRTKWYEWEGIATRKLIEELVAICEKAQGMDLMYQIDENQEWHTIGQLKKMINFFINLSIRFHRIRFQITGVSRIESAVFKKLEIVKGINEGLIKE